MTKNISSISQLLAVGRATYFPPSHLFVSSVCLSTCYSYQKEMKPIAFFFPSGGLETSFSFASKPSFFLETAFILRHV